MMSFHRFFRVSQLELATCIFELQCFVTRFISRSYHALAIISFLEQNASFINGQTKYRLLSITITACNLLTLSLRIT